LEVWIGAVGGDVVDIFDRFGARVFGDKKLPANGSPREPVSQGQRFR